MHNGNFGRNIKNTLLQRKCSPKVATMHPKVSPGVLIISGILYAKIQYMKLFENFSSKKASLKSLSASEMMRRLTKLLNEKPTQQSK